jgi:hypothetical protein
MRKLYFIFLFLMSVTFLYSRDFKAIQEGTTKEEVIQQLGKPHKIITKEEVPSLEYWVWYEKDNTWVMLFENDKSTGGAGTLEELLYGMLDLATLFNDFDMDLKADKISQNEIKETIKNKNLESIKDDIDITILEARIITNIFNERKAGFRYKIKNNSSETIYEMKIVVYFYDKNGNIYYEDERIPISSESWTNPIILKPNYSVILPEADERKYSTVDKMDIEEWDEGKIKIVIKDIELEQSE